FCIGDGGARLVGYVAAQRGGGELAGKPVGKPRKSENPHQKDYGASERLRIPSHAISPQVLIMNTIILDARVRAQLFRGLMMHIGNFSIVIICAVVLNPAVPAQVSSGEETAERLKQNAL